MNTTNKVLIYDNDCPLCSAYTHAFVRTGMLNKEGRKHFNNVDQEVFKMVDAARCNNEIPLIDVKTRQVWYGIDALLELLNEKIPFIKKVGNTRLLKWFLVRLYRFISYNRKVIVAIGQKDGYDSNPDFNIPYRLLFMFTFLIFNTCMLHPLYYNLFNQTFISNSSFSQFQCAHFAFVTINITIALLLGRKNGMEYVGQVNLLALITILLMTPLLLATNITGWQNRDITHLYLGLVSVLVLKEYARRMKYASVIQQFPIVVIINVACVGAFLIYLAY